MNHPAMEHVMEEAKELLALYVEYFKLISIERITHIVAMLVVVVVLTLLGCGALFYLMFALVYWLAPLLGSFTLSLLVVGVGYLLLMGVVWCARRVLIIHPIARMVIHFFKEERS